MVVAMFASRANAQVVLSPEAQAIITNYGHMMVHHEAFDGNYIAVYLYDGVQMHKVNAESLPGCQHLTTGVSLSEAVNIALYKEQQAKMREYYGNSYHSVGVYPAPVYGGYGTSGISIRVGGKKVGAAVNVVTDGRTAHVSGGVNVGNTISVGGHTTLQKKNATSVQEVNVSDLDKVLRVF